MTMTVERIRTEGGSHIEPVLDQGWDELRKPRWQAAVTTLDTGLLVRVFPTGQRTWRRGKWRVDRGMFDVLVGRAQCGAYTFTEAWTFLNGVTVGASQR